MWLDEDDPTPAPRCSECGRLLVLPRERVCVNHPKALPVQQGHSEYERLRRMRLDTIFAEDALL